MPAEAPAKPVGLKGLAELAGVSIATVSMALANHPKVNRETRLRIHELSHRVGYRRLRRASKNKASHDRRRFGFLLVGGPLQDEVHLGILHALTSATRGYGDRLEVQAIEDLAQPADVRRRALDFARDLDGVVSVGYIEASLLDDLENSRIPHVVFGHAMLDSAELRGRLCQIVTSNEVAMGDLAVRALLARGHRRIGFICETLPRGLWNARWLHGYYAALGEAGIAAAPGWVFVANKFFAGGELGASAMAALPEPPTAFVVPDVRLGSDFLNALRLRGRPLATDAIVIGGQKSLRARYGVEDVPWIGLDHDLPAEIAVRQLRAMCEKPMPCPIELLVPFETANLPDLSISNPVPPPAPTPA